MARADVTYKLLGFLDTVELSYGNGVSDDGRVVVGRVHTPTGWRAYRWIPEKGMVTLSDFFPPFVRSDATAVSRDGSIVVGSAEWPSVKLGGLWIGSEEPIFLEGGIGNNAFDIASDNMLVVGTWDATENGPTFAMRWPEPPYEGLMLQAGFGRSAAEAVSDDGSVIVGTIAEEDRSGPWDQAFRWTEPTGLVLLGGLIDIEDMPVDAQWETFSAAHDVSGDGKVIVGRAYTGTDFEAFRWTADSGMVGLGFLPGFGQRSVANAASEDGSVIVGFSGTSLLMQAFIWDADRACAI